MSNAFFLCLLLYIFLLQLALAGPPSMVSLSPHVARIVPHCAQQCLETFIAKNFPKSVCRNQQHLDCLCSRKSVSGLTFGEGALQCAASSCTAEVLQDSEVELYELCKDISSALPNTYGTLTATRVSVATAVSMTSTRTQTMTTPESTVFPSPTPSSISASFSGLSTSILPTSIATATFPPSLESPTSISSSPTHPHSSSTSVVASLASTSPAPTTKPVLTKPQIAGITVAGVASAALAFGLLFCIFCFRRRRSNKRLSGSSFGGDEVIETRPGSPTLPPTAFEDHQHTHQASSFLASKRQQAGNIPSADDSSRWSLSKRNTRPEDIGVAVAHGTDLEPSHDETPISATNHRTTSRLLPDKPTYLLFPPRQAQLRVVNPGNSPVSPQSPDSYKASSPVSANIGRSYKPAPRGLYALDTSQTSMQQGNQMIHPFVSDPFLDSHKDAEGLILSAEAPITAPTAWTRSLETMRKPVPARQSQSNHLLQPLKTQSQPSLRMREPSVYVGRPTFGVPSGAIPPAEQAVRSNAKRRRSVKRPSTVFSTTSETSFEDAGDEDDMLTHAFLAPVAESPKVRSPPSKITYPRIPGSMPASTGSRRPSPESPTPRPPPKNPLRAIVAQQQYRSGQVSQPGLVELQGSPVTSPISPLSRRDLNSQIPPDSPRTAKWQILVGSGQEGIENAAPSPSPRRTVPERSL